MSPKGTAHLFVLVMACTVFVTVSPAGPPDMMSADNTAFIAKKSMMKCYNKGYPSPKITSLTNIFNNSKMLEGERTGDQSNSFSSTFLHISNMVTGATNRNSKRPTFMNAAQTMAWNCSNLPAVIRMMNSSDPSCCYIEAFVAPLSWATLTATRENCFDSSDYNTSSWAAKPVSQNIPSARSMLPTRVDTKNMIATMNILQEVYASMTDEQRAGVFDWAKEQVLQNSFSCTMKPLSHPKSTMSKPCKPSSQWVNSETSNMMGHYLSSMRPDDVESFPTETSCGFFSSGQFKSNMTSKLNPSSGRKFLKRIQGCPSVSELIDKLGPSACYYDATNSTSDTSKKLLPQSDDCDGPTAFKSKRRLVNSLMTGSSSAQNSRDLGRSVTLLSPKQSSELSAKNLKDVLQNVGPRVKWSRSQSRISVEKQSGERKCGELSGQQSMELQSVAAGLPNCVLKKMKHQDILNNTETMKSISKHMRKGQLKAMSQGSSDKVPPSESVQKLAGPLLRSVSLKNLEKANITSLEEVENKTWSSPQAAYLANKMHGLKKLQYRRSNSVLQGITCEMIGKVNGSDVSDMAESITETPQWISKVQAQCAARQLFRTLEKERTDYFKNITVQEMERIPTMLSLLSPPSKVKKLPDYVCQVFLDKMETSNSTILPRRAPSRPALAERASLCSPNGRNISELTISEVLMLGPSLCELKPSTLSLMTPEVLKFSLKTMSLCEDIPQPHRAESIQSVNQTFGSPSEWPAETMESSGPLISEDDTVVSSLLNEPWMKDVLVFSRSQLTQVSDALKKKIFDLTTTTSGSARKRRAVNADPSSNGTEPTEALIEESGSDNVLWTAANSESMSNSTFSATIDILGSVPGYSSDQSKVLYRKAVENFGPVSNMTESLIIRSKCITQSFSNSESEMLPLSSDSSDEISVCGWNDSQSQSVWKGVSKYNNSTVPQSGSAEMVQSSRFICGLNSTEIGQLSISAFSDAVGSMDGLQCPVEVLQESKNVAVSAFGAPSNWTEAQVSDLDNIIAGLGVSEIASLSPSVFPFISKSCISHITPENFAALSVDQSEALGPDNAAMVTSEQRAALTAEKISVLEKAATGAGEDQSQTQPTESGAPVLSSEGFSTFMKPVSFFFIGFLSS